MQNQAAPIINDDSDASLRSVAPVMQFNHPGHAPRSLPLMRAVALQKGDTHMVERIDSAIQLSKDWDEYSLSSALAAHHSLDRVHPAPQSAESVSSGESTVPVRTVKAKKPLKTSGHSYVGVKFSSPMQLPSDSHDEVGSTVSSSLSQTLAGERVELSEAVGAELMETESLPAATLTSLMDDTEVSRPGDGRLQLQHLTAAIEAVAAKQKALEDQMLVTSSGLNSLVTSTSNLITHLGDHLSSAAADRASAVADRQSAAEDRASAAADRATTRESMAVLAKLLQTLAAK